MLSHYFIFKSATNTADIIYFAQKIKVNGVILQGPDFPQVSSSIEQFLRKKNIPIKAAKICTNKFRMKKFLRKVGIPVPNFQLLKKNDKKKIIFKFPVVIKPLDRSGSRGVLLCENLKNFHVLKKKPLLKLIKIIYLSRNILMDLK